MYSFYVIDERVHGESDGQQPAQPQQDGSHARHPPQRKHGDRQHRNSEQ